MFILLSTPLQLSVFPELFLCIFLETIEVKDSGQESKDDLPHWAKEGLKNPNPEFGFDVYKKDNLPHWAQKGMLTNSMALLNSD